MVAAKIGGTNISILDRLKSEAWKHKFSAGTSNGSLMEAAAPLHACDVGLTAETNAISGVKDATATVAVNIVVHVAA